MKMTAALLLCFFFTVLEGGCAPFRDSAFSDQVLNPERDLNITAQSKLADVDGDGKIRIAVFADPHQNYKELDYVIRHINRTENIDFAVSLGDVTNSSYGFEFDQFLGSFLLLRPPAFNIIGNHDALGAGPKIFRQIFGPVNFFFESVSHRFVFFNSANLETPELFDPNWLKSTVQSSTKRVIIFTHIPLRDPERFHGEAQQMMDDLTPKKRTRELCDV